MHRKFVIPVCIPLRNGLPVEAIFRFCGSWKAPEFFWKCVSVLSHTLLSNRDGRLASSLLGSRSELHETWGESADQGCIACHAAAGGEDLDVFLPPN